ncbi:hypothetical protein PINS_up013339 [Pythium insidiosum]|nr:hypothetical protein PINS_up013339 [Pythium insidiosum]
MYLTITWCLGSLEERLERKQQKITLLEDKVSQLQQDNVKLLHEKEVETEKNAELQEQLQFIRESRVEDGTATDIERRQLLEKLQQSLARESELQNDLEEQQRKWALDRSNIHQQDATAGEGEAARGGGASQDQRRL